MKKILLLFAAAICAVASWATDEVTATFTGSKLEVALNNTTQFVAFQMDIVLDADVTIDNFEKAGRLATGEAVTIDGASVSTEFVLATNQISVADGKQTVRVIAYNLGNNAIQDATGTIFTASLSAEPTAVKIENIAFVDLAGLQEAYLAYVEAQKGSDVVLGDVNNDGYWTLADALAVFALSVLEGSEREDLATSKGWILEAADANGVDDLGLADALVIFKLGIENPDGYRN